MVGVDDEHRRVRVMPEMQVEPALEILQVVALDVLFHRATTHLDTVQKCGDARLQVNHQVGPRHIAVERSGYLLVHRELAVRKVLGSKYGILVVSVVAHDQVVEQVALHGVVLQLLVAVEQEEQLGLERVGFPILVEFLQEGVVLQPRLNEGVVLRFGDNPREGSLPCPDDAFYGEKMYTFFGQH